MRKTRPKPGATTRPPMLFCIGLSAGACASLFPRLMPILLGQQTAINVELFSFGYLLGAAAFSALIGLVMMWTYWGTRLTPQALFMAALGVPSLLSGSLNMSNSVNEGTRSLADLAREHSELLHTVEKLSDIKVDTITLPKSEDRVRAGDRVGAWLGIAAAEAGEQPPAGAASPLGLNYDPRVQLQAPEQQKNYLVVLSASTDRARIERELVRMRELGIADVGILTFKDEHYLTAGDQQTKSRALRRAVELKNQLGLDSVRLLELR